MKHIRLLVLTALAIFSLSLVLQASGDETASGTAKSADTTGVRWYGYVDAWQKAKAEKKHMFIDFTATWCTWCKRMDATTFADPRVVKLLNNDFVAVKLWDHDTSTLDLDGYQITVRDLIKKEFRVTGYPALWFVSPYSQKIGPAGGYLDTDRFLKVLDIVKYYRYDSTRTETGELKTLPEKDSTK
jgi:thioredoxin-related protein